MREQFIRKQLIQDTIYLWVGTVYYIPLVDTTRVLPYN